jgi:hypothetical protein
LKEGLRREVDWYRHKEVPLTDLDPVWPQNGMARNRSRDAKSGPFVNED